MHYILDGTYQLDRPFSLEKQIFISHGQATLLMLRLMTRDHGFLGINGKPEVSLSGRVRDGGSKQLIAKQLGALAEDMPRFDLETGQIKVKKAKKQKTPEEQALADLKVFEKKMLYSKFYPQHIA